LTLDTRATIEADGNNERTVVTGSVVGKALALANLRSSPSNTEDVDAKMR